MDGGQCNASAMQFCRIDLEGTRTALLFSVAEFLDWGAGGGGRRHREREIFQTSDWSLVGKEKGPPSVHCPN